MLAFLLTTNSPVAKSKTPAAQLPWRQPLTLKDELMLVGISETIPLDAVRPYQAQQVAEWTSRGENYHAAWERVTYGFFYLLNPPSDVRDTYNKAIRIEGVTIYAERFKGDPFYFAQLRDELECFAFHDAPGFVAPSQA